MLPGSYNYILYTIGNLRVISPKNYLIDDLDNLVSKGGMHTGVLIFMINRHNTSSLRANNNSNRIGVSWRDYFSRLKDCQYCDQPLCLNLRWWFQSTKKAKILAGILKNENCSQDLLVDLQDSYEPEIIVMILKALRTERSPKNLQLYLCNIDSSVEIENEIVKLLKFSRPQQDLQIDISETDFSENGVKEIVKALLGNTSVTEINLDPCSATEEQLNIIKYCCFRNQLIKKLPAFEFVIKQISFQHNMYRPSTTFMTSQSLKCVVGSFLSLNKQVPVPDSKLPLELKEYIEELDKIAIQLLPHIPSCHQ